MSESRAWCARAQYPGLDPFLFGTVFAESELEAERKISRAWGKVCPHPEPKWLAYLPGTLVFREGDGE